MEGILQDFATENKPAYRGHNLMGFIIGMPIPVFSMWLWFRVSTGPSCETFINKPLLVLGILLLLVLLLGSCTRRPKSMLCCCRETIMFLLFCILLVYGIFILAVSTPGGGRPSPGVDFQDYVLDDYSHWLQKRVNNTQHWDKLKRCLVKREVCHKFFYEYVNDTGSQFFARPLSSIESGCCKPPTNCDFNYTSALKWTKPKVGNTTNNMDCNKWDEDPNKRCFDCQSCKAGFANDVKNSWVIVGIVIIVVVKLIVLPNLKLISRMS